MNCIGCGDPVQAAGAGRPRAAPLASPGLLFYTRGHYESGIFHPRAGRADSEYLRIALCDSCLAIAGELEAVEHGTLDWRPGEPLPGEWTHRRWRLPPRPEERGTGD